MTIYQHVSALWRSLARPACALLALAGLAACGATGQAVGATSAGVAQATAGTPQLAHATVASIAATPEQRSAAAPVASALPVKQQPTASATASLGPTAGSPIVRPHSTTAPAPPTLLRPTPPPPPIAPTVAAASAGSWQTYRSESAGYSIGYPPEWTAGDRSNQDGANVAAFAPAAGGAGIMVTVFTGAPPATEPSESVERTCQRVTVGWLTGTRCFDPTTLGISTTLAGKGRTYIIATTGKGLDERLYQQFLDSFALIRT